MYIFSVICCYINNHVVPSVLMLQEQTQETKKSEDLRQRSVALTVALQVKG